MPAIGAQSGIERLEIQLLLEAAYRQYGYDFRDYALSAIRPKIYSRLRAENHQTITRYTESLIHDPRVMDRFLLALSSAPVSMFEETSVFTALRQTILPQLQDNYFIRIWLVQSTTGETAYSLAILLKEEGFDGKARIYATNMDESVLKRARQGIFPLDRFGKFEQHYRESGGTGALADSFDESFDSVVIKPELRSCVTFAQHNVVTDGSLNEFHVILSLNVLPHFGRVLQERVFQLIHESLSVPGYLVLGPKASMENHLEAQAYEMIEPDCHIYRRIR